MQTYAIEDNEGFVVAKVDAESDEQIAQYVRMWYPENYTYYVI